MKKRSGGHADLVLRPRTHGQTITEWLCGELRGAILDGRLRRGSMIPPTRELASRYGISRRIVVLAFDQLCDEGYLAARVGDGTRVSGNIPEDFLAAAPQRPRTDAKPREVDPLYRRPVRAFRPIEPALAEFPVELWGRLEGRCIRHASTAVLAGGDAAGHWPLREEICAYLGASRGVSCSPEEVVITSGAQQSLDLIARVLLRKGDRVWMEDPGYASAAAIFRLAGARIVPVPVDEHGIRPELGRARCRAPKAIYLTPAHQFPLGATLRLDRRLELLQSTRAKQTPILEDDYDSEFRFAGRPVPAMKGLAGAEHVFLLGTFNKSLFPALRLGYIVVSRIWLDRILELRRLTDRYPASLPQVVLTAFMTEGHYAKHLRRMRELYGSRLEALRSDVKRYLDGAASIPPIEAGLNTPLFLHNGLTSRQAAERAARRDLEVWSLDQFALARRDLRGLVLGFAAFDRREIRKGVIELAESLSA